MSLMVYQRVSTNCTNNSKKLDRWIFTKSQIDNPPSIRHLTKPITLRQERLLRKWCALYIMATGRKLFVPAPIIYAAIVYMQRFFMVNCFQDFNSRLFCSVCLYVACKFEGLARPFRYLVREACNAKQKGYFANTIYTPSRILDGLKYEDILLESLHYELQIEHPSAIVFLLCQKVASGKDLAYIANSLVKCNLLFTVMCLVYKPEVIACVCMHQASVWSHRHIPLNNADGKPWYAGFDNVTPGLLNLLAADFVCVLNAFSPSIKDYILASSRKMRTKV